MRNSYIANTVFLLSATVFLLTACKEKADKDPGGGHKETVIDSSVRQLTAPANQKVAGSIPTIRAVSETRIYASAINGVVSYDTRNQTAIASRVAGRIERLMVKYNYQPVRKGQLIMEIYSPDLAAAQRELIYLSKNNDEQLLNKAKEKLQLLGMQTGQINEVLRTGNILYRIPVFSNSDGYILEKTAAAQTPAAGLGSTAAATGGDGMAGMGGAAAPATNAAPAAVASPVLLREGQYVAAGQSLFTIYRSDRLVAEFAFPPALAARIDIGKSLLFYPNAGPDQVLSGSIGLVEPVFRNGENFTLARVYLTGKQLQPGEMLTASMPVVYRKSSWLPKEAVWMQGAQAVVFVKEQNMFSPYAVRTGIVLDDAIQLLSDMGDRELASNAFYLVDSESFIKIKDSIQ